MDSPFCYRLATSTPSTTRFSSWILKNKFAQLQDLLFPIIQSKQSDSRLRVRGVILCAILATSTSQTSIRPTILVDTIWQVSLYTTSSSTLKIVSSPNWASGSRIASMRFLPSQQRGTQNRIRLWARLFSLRDSPRGCLHTRRSIHLAMKQSMSRENSQRTIRNWKQPRQKNDIINEACSSEQQTSIGNYNGSNMIFAYSWFSSDLAPFDRSLRHLTHFVNRWIENRVRNGLKKLPTETTIMVRLIVLSKYGTSVSLIARLQIIIRKGEIDTLKNMKNVIFRIRLSFICVFDWWASILLVVNYRKLIIKKFITKITKDENTWPVESFEPMEVLLLNTITSETIPNSRIVVQTKNEENLIALVLKQGFSRFYHRMSSGAGADSTVTCCPLITFFDKHTHNLQKAFEIKPQRCCFNARFRYSGVEKTTNAIDSLFFLLFSSLRTLTKNFVFLYNLAQSLLIFQSQPSCIILD